MVLEQSNKNKRNIYHSSAGDVVRRKPLRKFSLRGDGKKAHEWPVARKNAFQKRETGPRKQCAQCTENKIEASRMGSE